MKIAITSYGSFGDLHPVLALAIALRDSLEKLPENGAPHEIIFLTHPEYENKITASGLKFHPIGPKRDEFAARLKMDLREFTEKAGKDIGFLFEHWLVPDLEAICEESLEIVQTSDLVIGSSYSYGVHLASLRANKPFISCLLSPAVAMSAYDPPLLKEAPFWLSPKNGLGVIYNRYLFALGRLKMSGIFGKIAKIYRKYKQPTQDDNGGIRTDFLNLCLYSKLLQTIQPDFPPNSHICGTPWYDSLDGQEPKLTQKTQDFLDNGPAPLVFSLGSVAVLHGEDFFAKAIKISQKLNCRAILLTGLDSSFLSKDFGPDILCLDYAPHSLLFPRAKIIIQHGGIGSSNQSLKAGRPILTVPVFGDQFDNGHRIKKLGSGLMLAYKDWTITRAVKILSKLIKDQSFEQNAQLVKAKIIQENGAKSAVDQILSCLKRVP